MCLCEDEELSIVVKDCKKVVLMGVMDFSS